MKASVLNLIKNVLCGGDLTLYELIIVPKEFDRRYMPYMKSVEMIGNYDKEY